MATMQLKQEKNKEIAFDNGKSAWTYEEAFKRNRGLITKEEQQKLRNSRVAIAGMGGVGGLHLVTLARLGIGKFTIADPDTFEVANFNRQLGARISTIGRKKVEVMAEIARDINPEIELNVFPVLVDETNVDAFLNEANLFIDGLDFFAIEARRLCFQLAAEKRIWAITAGPIGFSTAWLSFNPDGMTFDEYFDLHNPMDRVEQLIAFTIGLAPRGTHLPYLDLSQVNLCDETAPCSSLACQLAAGIASSEAIKLLLGRGKVRCAPSYQQVDAYRGFTAGRKLWHGNRHPLQQLKRWWLRRAVRRMVAGYSQMS